MTATKMRAMAVAAVAAAGLAVTAIPGQASAATDPNALHISYDASGYSLIAKTGSSVKLGPTTLKTALNPDGTFTGTLPLPPSSTTFKAIGLLPISATVNFIPVGTVTGTLGSVPLQVKSSTKYTLRLSNVVVGGIPTPVGNSCQTITPATIPAVSDPNSNFDIVNGGTLTGSYTIPLFAGCGLTTALIDLLVPGPNNTISLTLSNAVFGS